MKQTLTNTKITGTTSIEEMLGDIMGYKDDPPQPLVDLPITQYFETVCAFESAMTIGADYDTFSRHNEDKSRVEALWESTEMKLKGINRNWRANYAAVYFVTSSMSELRISEINELLNKIKNRFKVKEVIWGCVRGFRAAMYITIDVYHNNIKPEQSTPEELRRLDDMGFGAEKDDDYDRLLNER